MDTYEWIELLNWIREFDAVAWFSVIWSFIEWREYLGKVFVIGAWIGSGLLYEWLWLSRQRMALIPLPAAPDGQATPAPR